MPGPFGQMQGVRGAPPGMQACPTGLLRSSSPAIAGSPGLPGPPLHNEDSVGASRHGKMNFDERRERGRDRYRVRGESTLGFLGFDSTQHPPGVRRPGPLGRMQGVLLAPPGMAGGPAGLLGSHHIGEGHVGAPGGQGPMDFKEQEFDEKRERERLRREPPLGFLGFDSSQPPPGIKMQGSLFRGQE